MSGLHSEVIRQRLDEIQSCHTSPHYFTPQRSLLMKQLALELGLDVEKAKCHRTLLEELYNKFNEVRNTEQHN